MAAAATVTKTAAAATATAVALNKAVGVTRCGGQVVSSRLPARTAAKQLSRTVKKERQEARAGFAAGRLIAPGTQSQRRVGRGRSVGRVTTREAPGQSAECAVLRFRSPEGVVPVGRGWRLLVRELPLALTGGRVGVSPRFAFSLGPRSWGSAKARGSWVHRILMRMLPRRQSWAAPWEDF